MDKNYIEKAIITTVNRAASSKIYADKDNTFKNNSSNNDVVKRAFENLTKLMKGQLDHQDVINISNKDPERFYKFFWFNPKIKPEDEDSNYKVLENHFDLGFCGVKIHSGIHLIKIPRDIIKLVSFMQEYNKKFPLFVHLTPKFSAFRGISSKDIAKLAKNYPNLRIIIGHAALAMEIAIDLGLSLKQYKNVFFETSCSIPYGILSLIKMVGHKRILFGSDSPITNPIKLEIDKILCLPITDEQKQDVFFNNIDSLIRN